MGQITKHLVDQQEGIFSANTHTNPKEHGNTITRRSGKVIFNNNIENDEIFVYIKEIQEGK